MKNTRLQTFTVMLLVTVAMTARWANSQERSSPAGQKSPPEKKRVWPGDDKSKVYLVDIASRELFESHKPYAGNRLFLRWEPLIEKWVLESSDSEGKVGFKPQTFIVPPHSIIRGDMVGLGRNDFFRYVGRKRKIENCGREPQFDVFTWFETIEVRPGEKAPLFQFWTYRWNGEEWIEDKHIDGTNGIQ